MLDSNDQDDSTFDFLAAIKKRWELNSPIDPFIALENKIDESRDWLFGYLTYDLKNDIEELFSNNTDNQCFPKIHFFVPEIILKVKNKNVVFLYDVSCSDDEIDLIFNTICNTIINEENIDPVQIHSRLTKSEYVNNIQEIQKHLQAGDIYEMNYCQEFYVDHVKLDPFNLFTKLNKLSMAPFSSLYRLNHHFCLCASPERYLKKKGSKIISQPIKGTIKKSSNQIIDEHNKKKLLNSSKDFSENVMIVDLVRNDLSRIAKKDTVNVDELVALYSYNDVHHLISTISCELDSRKTIVDAIKASFPMGSMTGAPKIKAMELIEKFETNLRGIYSGAIGYIKPNKDFDFNVVIRSIFYNQQSNYLSFIVGGAITIESDPELEYEECLIKAKSIFNVLS